MLSINTNLSSLIAQQSLSSSTAKLNQAIERMSTGFKINHAKDNAANYSISTNMSTQIGAYDVAANNVAMGMDLVTTASDIISTMQDHATRLQALSTQARNGTYGAQSMAAINSEAAAIMAEINRLYSTAEYNNVSLFNREAFQLSAEHKALTETVSAKAENNGFITDPKTYTDEEVAAMTRVKDVSTFSSGQKYAIYTKEELEKLRDYVNDENDTSGVEFVLGADIDLSSIANWTPIGIGTNPFNCFAGSFDGNGHVIKNLTIDNPTENSQGLFGNIYSSSSSMTIKGLGLQDVSVKGGVATGGLTGNIDSGTINNCYVTGIVSSTDEGVGGLAGFCNNISTITNCYVVADVAGTYYTGGLVGWAGDYLISDCYAMGDVSGIDHIGGLAGIAYNVTNSYATGNVSGDNEVGGLVGNSGNGTITNSYATGSVSGKSWVGGLAGQVHSIYATLTLDITGSTSYGTASGNDKVGSFIGGIVNTSNGTSFGTVNIASSQSVAQEGINSIGGCYQETYVLGVGNTYIPSSNNDMTAMLAGISAVEFKNIMTSLQVGINSDSSCQLNFDTNFKFDLSSIGSDISSDEALTAIMEFTNLLSEKSTQLGAVQNRLDSALESIEVNLENLVSSRSTIRDADIAEESSAYIRQQILQQASATLLATANQSPSIALQLI